MRLQDVEFNPGGAGLSLGILLVAVLVCFLAFNIGSQMWNNYIAPVSADNIEIVE